MLLGTTEPRIFTPPLRELTEETSLGFEVIAFAQLLGLQLFPYQKWLLIHALELRPDGGLRFRTVIVLIARQNGKTFLSILLGMYFLYVLQVALILSTAQDLDLAEETWQAAVDLATEQDDNDQYLRPEFAAEIKRVVRVNGQKSLELRRGPKWKVRAPNRRAGRGKTTGLLFLDELREHVNWDAWGALSSTTIAVADALTWCVTNAGDARSVVLRHLRRLAHLALGDPDGIFGDSEQDPLTQAAIDEDEDLAELMGDVEDDLAIFEWSAAPGRGVWDRDGWVEANPAMGHGGGLTERTFASAVRKEPRHVVITELLCQWLSGSIHGPFPDGAWESGTDAESEIPQDARLVFAAAVSYDRAYTTIGVAGFRADGKTHVEVVARRAGTEWPAEWFAERASTDSQVQVVIHENGPAGVLSETLQEVEGLQVVLWKGADLGKGHALFFDMVTQERGSAIMHLPQPTLDAPAGLAQVRPLAHGVWVWDLKNDQVDVAPLSAVTAATWGLHLGVKDSRSAYEDHDLVIV